MPLQVMVPKSLEGKEGWPAVGSCRCQGHGLGCIATNLGQVLFLQSSSPPVNYSMDNQTLETFCTSRKLTQ